MENLEIIILSDLIQTEMWYHTYEKSKKDTNELIYKTDSQT